MTTRAIGCSQHKPRSRWTAWTFTVALHASAHGCVRIAVNRRAALERAHILHARSSAERHWNVPTYCMRGQPPSGIATCPHTACAVIRRAVLERAHIEHLCDFSTSMFRILGRSCLTDPCLLMRSAGRALAECEFRDPHRMRDKKGQ